MYGERAKAAISTIALHEQAGDGGAGIQAYLARLQQPDDRIDIARNERNTQMADTARLLEAYSTASHTDWAVTG